jgi:hypothetical protein
MTINLYLAAAEAAAASCKRRSHLNMGNINQLYTILFYFIEYD